ncbi:MAG TPA: OmpA family protein [Patescibacteria group bacterium]|nr:OmpA family protein [Patescibacteria group bacterium]
MPTSRLTPLAKGFITVVILAVVGIFAWHFGWFAKFFPDRAEQSAIIPQKIDLPQVKDAVAKNAIPAVSMPGQKPGCADRPEIRQLVWAWNSQMGKMFATGGSQATEGSLMCTHGVNLKLIRQDDSSQMQAMLVKFATMLKKGDPNPSEGAHFVSIMGDGAAQFLQGLNPTLAKLGPEYTAEIIGSSGYSRGEDKFMGPVAWLPPNSAAARGGLVAGVLRDGDWNIAIKWIADNGLCNNPDEKVFDPNCVNWLAANDYVDAAQKYVAHACEERPVVVIDPGTKKYKKTGETRQVCVDGVVTWTPGDVIVAKKRGGLVSIVSTKLNNGQMPEVMIGIRKWNREHSDVVKNMLAAILEGGDQVLHYENALRRAAFVSNMVYAEKDTDPDYWLRYYKGTTEIDATGLQVELGGSKANNLADDLFLFGLSPGSGGEAASTFVATYTQFGNYAHENYPQLIPTFPPAKNVLNLSYLRQVAAEQPTASTAEVPTFAAADSGPLVEVGRRAWNINFDTGKATFSKSAERQLEELYQGLVVSGNTVIVIHGHTDNVGTPKKNRDLSEARAFAVKHYLETRAPKIFPTGRIRPPIAHGDSEPLEPNTTADGRAKNRRVEIVIGENK